MKKTIVFITVLLLALFFTNPRANAATINAASCSQADVQNAINTAQAGDTVVVPSGTCTYTTTVAYTPSVTINKAVAVIGQTTCSGKGATLTCTDNTIITVNTGTAFEELPFILGASNARLSGISINDTRSSGGSQPLIKTAKNITGWRIDHVHLLPPNNATVNGIMTQTSGLVDHVYIDTVDTAVYVWNEAGGGDTYPGDTSWTQALMPGSGTAVYVEDSKFVYSAVLNGIDNYAGGRVVYRYNDITGTNIGNHGLDSGGLRSNLLIEIYKNTFTNSGTHISQWYVSRGGTYLIWNNTISGSGGSYDRFLDLRNYRSDSNYTGWSPVNWGYCDGTNSRDQNTPGYQGWPCQDQIGRGPNQVSMPAYSWLNSWKGAEPTIANVYICDFEDCTRARAYHILNNRDFYMEVPSFNGTSGTGSGLLSARPSACTSAVAYWAIDTATLYKCTSTNTWTAYYTPYTYPHPLQGVVSTLKGDVNQDTKVDILDVQALVNQILGLQNYGTSADVNLDGRVDVLDLQALVNIILGV